LKKRKEISNENACKTKIKKVEKGGDGDCLNQRQRKKMRPKKWKRHREIRFV
jgi:hypothetical protein